MGYEDLLNEAESQNLIVKEKTLTGTDGRIKGNRIAIRKGLHSSVQKACVLAEELGHHHTTTGRILDQSDSGNRKQERQARVWAYDRLIGLPDIIKSYERRCDNLTDMADYLDVTEEFLLNALDFYREKYGTGVQFGEYYISFEPFFTVYKGGCL